MFHEVVESERRAVGDPFDLAMPLKEGVVEKHPEAIDMEPFSVFVAAFVLFLDQLVHILYYESPSKKIFQFLWVVFLTEDVFASLSLGIVLHVSQIFVYLRV